MGRKRKIDIVSNTNESSNSSGHSSLTGTQRTAANDRERTRMRVLSKAFVRLKTSLPWVPTDTKLSKLDTLKLATSYISYLTRILQEDENSDLSNLSYTFQPAASINGTSNKMISSIRFTAFEKNKKLCENLNNAIVTNNTGCMNNNNNAQNFTNPVTNQNGFCWPAVNLNQSTCSSSSSVSPELYYDNYRNHSKQNKFNIYENKT